MTVHTKIIYRVTGSDGINYGEFIHVDEARNTASKIALGKFTEEIIVEKLVIETVGRYCYR